MPWNNLQEVPDSIRTHRKIALTLAQANRWAEIRDAIVREKRKVESPEAVAWSVWNREHKIKDNAWVKVKSVDEKYIHNFVGNTSLIEQGRHPYWEYAFSVVDFEDMRTTIHLGHDHGIDVDENGDGETTKDSGHKHKIVKWIIEEIENHTHRIPRNMRDIEIKRPEDRIPKQPIPGHKEYEEFAVWPTARVNTFPDSSFFWVETGGKKDETNRTVPRSLRHLPYKDENGRIDLPHVRNALARLNQVKGLPSSVRDRIRAKAQRILAEAKKEYDEYAVAKPFGHPAGQMLQAKRIISLIPKHSKFVEPFAGSATIFFSKNPTNGPEILNDLNPEYVRALKTLKTLTDAEIQSITKKNWTGSAKFHKAIVGTRQPSSKVEWLHWFLYKTVFSFGSLGKSFDSSDEGRISTLGQAKRYESIRDRMKNAEVTREDFRDSITKHDAPDTFFYIDPPYYSSSDKRAKSFKIGQVDLDEFVDILKSIKGKFITSIGNESEWIKKLKSAGFHVQKITSPRSIPALSKGDKTPTADWPLVSNFPMVSVGVYSVDEFEIVDYDNNIYTPDTLINEINKSFTFPAVIHEVPDGLRCIIRKRGKDVTVHSLVNDNEIDCTVKFPVLRKELSGLKTNFTLDSFISGWAQGYRKGKFYGEESVLGYFKKKIKSNDSGLYATVFDMRWMDGQCLKDKPLSERLQSLEYIVGMTEHMKLIEVTEANNEMELMECVEFHARLSGSLGSHIRSSLGDHHHNGIIFRLHEVWSTKFINDLPDSAFAFIESDGKKDEQGKTVPRSLRHLPYKNDKGGIDLPHLRNAIARVSHVKLKDGNPIPREKRDSIVARLRSILEKTNESGHVMGSAKGSEKEESDHSDFIDVYFTMDEVKRYDDNPYSVEISGVFFHRGEHKEMNYDDKNLMKMKLTPRPGESLVYFNFYHDKTEYLKAGILTDLFWDAEVVWIDPINHEKGKGAVMYKAVITHPVAVNEILNENINNISAELFREIEHRSDGKNWAYDIDAVGGALTTSPQLPAADINERCYTDPKTKKRVCK